MSYFLRPHGLQHARLPCPSLSSGVCNLVLYSPGLHFHHQTHPQLSIISALAQLRFFLDLLAIVLHFSPVAYWTPSNLGGSSSGVISFCLFTLLMRSSRQEHWSGLPFPPPGDLFDPGIQSVPIRSPALARGFFTTSATWCGSQQIVENS